MKATVPSGGSDGRPRTRRARQGAERRRRLRRHDRGRDEVTWEDLAAEPFLAVGPEPSVRRLTDAAFEQAGAVVTPAAEAGNVATVGGLVAASLGVSAMPALVLPLLGPGHVVHRELTGPAVERRLDIVVRARRTLPPAAAAFLDLLDEARAEGREVPAGATWIHH
ncbi:LysR substrate-binding domain-containing protein [Nonomuraea sp. B10E15]|uniref:LysR substrate-binding domain-containing protein n=1 Tax=Nonomuraea sp. B10E15 TaxID=3153560 RepID=UPI00325EC4B4